MKDFLIAYRMAARTTRGQIKSECVKTACDFLLLIERVREAEAWANNAIRLVRTTGEYGDDENIAAQIVNYILDGEE